MKFDTIPPTKLILVVSQPKGQHSPKEQKGVFG